MDPLAPAELRVLGALIEKDLSTPEHYPLSLNALTLACNQKTNREPVTAYEENDVLEALEALSNRGIVEEIRGSRVLKYAHQFGGSLNLSRPELALLAVLMLRGQQTPGELRQRTASMHSFEDTDAVLSSLRRMDAGLVIEMARQPGWKETRWAQLLGGSIDSGVAAAAAPVIHHEPLSERIDRLERELNQLRAEFDELRKALG